MGPPMTVKTRVQPECNYRAVFFEGKTLRFALDSTKPIKELTWPEFWDVKITNKCYGKCPWCYQNSTSDSENYDINGIDKIFGTMNENQRPFQVAIGGGEPTEHPHFAEVLSKFYNLGIMPNYTTNGMNLTPVVLEATKKYCGGVAVSTHSHLEWKNAVIKLEKMGVKVNLHIIIGTKQDVDTLFETMRDVDVEHYVLLPLLYQGRAKNLNNKLEEAKEYLFIRLKELSKNQLEKVAFGAKFYSDLLKNSWIPASLYEPEFFSKYLDLKDLKIYNSSFEADD